MLDKYSVLFNSTVSQKMKTRILLSVLVALGIAACSSSSLPTTKAWHKTEGLSNEPMSLPSCNLERVLALKVGDKLGDVERIVGYPAVRYYYGADFLTLHASDPKVDAYYWEVALKNGTEATISDISFKKIIILPL
jgi:hypothetical protein